jgi:glyoxylase-like metal-dependent hydrolase (beta-lactamase superfamily II)
MNHIPAKATAIQLGEFRAQIVSGGNFRMDGGTVFGVVPKVLWSRVLEADEKNNVAQATNCLLIDTGRQKLLVDTGYGSKLSDKQRAHLDIPPGNPLLESLTRLALEPSDIDVVILSHLHFDHAGGATLVDDRGDVVPAFPNAQYIVQQQEWAIATADLPEVRGAYAVENFQPLADSGRLVLVDGSTEITPGINVILTGGHTPGHQVIQVNSQGHGAIYMGDLCPTSSHLRVCWETAFDLDVLTSRRKKFELLGEIADHDVTVFFDHDPHVTHARIRRDEDRDFVVASGDPA